MNYGIEITETELKFTSYPSKEIGLAISSKSFTLNLNAIQLIAISPRLALDDETIFILIIDTQNKIYPLPDAVIGTDGLKSFEKYFGLNPIHEEWQKFQYEDHYGKVDKIVYPKELYWNNLFKNDWKILIRSLYSWIVTKSFYGNLNTNFGSK